MECISTVDARAVDGHSKSSSRQNPRESLLYSQSAMAIPTAIQVDALSKSRLSSPEHVVDPIDRSVLHDNKHRPITVDRWLHSKPLKHEISSRPGPNGKKLHYLSGDSVTRTLNQVFGYDGWNLSIIKTDQVACNQQNSNNNDAKAAQGSGKWHVAYLAQVRITHVRSGSFREDVGAGDSLDRSLATAVQHALKGSITDAMKRAARHFGDKLGNSLYSTDFKYNEAPTTAAQALEQYDKDHNRNYGSLSSKEVVTSKPIITPSSSNVEAHSVKETAWSEGQTAIQTSSNFTERLPPHPVTTRNVQSTSSSTRDVANKGNGSIHTNAGHAINPILPSAQIFSLSNAQVVSASIVQEEHGLQELYGSFDESFWPMNSPPSCLGRPIQRPASTTEHAVAHASKKQKVNPYSS